LPKAIDLGILFAPLELDNIGVLLAQGIVGVFARL
jgi:hypothetical protein